METRKARMIVNTGGNGGSTFRATLPTNWIRKMGLNEENRDLKLGFDGEKITITNNEEEVRTLRRILEATKEEIKKEMDRTGYIDDSDNIERFVEILVREYVDEDDILDIDEVVELLYDHMNKIYKRKGSCNERGDYTGCYYKNKQGLEDWEESLIY